MRGVSYVSETKKHRSNNQGGKDMFGLTALVATLIGTTIVGCGTGFAIVCITES